MIDLTDNLLYQTALARLRAGFWIVPLRPLSKKPMWKDCYRRAIRTEGSLRKVWTRTPDANVGILCGRGFVVADHDDDGAIRLAGIDGWPVSYRTYTRRGAHDPYRWPAELPAPRTGKLKHYPDTDLKGSRSHVVCAPSQVLVEMTGEIFTYAEDVEWAEAGYPLDWLHVPPQVVIDAMLPRRRRQPVAPAMRRDLPPSFEGNRAAWLAEDRDGHRHQAMIRVVLHDLAHGRSHEETKRDILASAVGSKAREQSDPNHFIDETVVGQALAYRAETEIAGTTAGAIPPVSDEDLARLDSHEERVRTDPRLTEGRRNVLLGFVGLARERGLDFYAPLKVIAGRVGVSFQQVSKVKIWLVNNGWLIDRKKDGKEIYFRQAHYYWLAIPNEEVLRPQNQHPLDAFVRDVADLLGVPVERPDYDRLLMVRLVNKWGMLRVLLAAERYEGPVQSLSEFEAVVATVRFNRPIFRTQADRNIIRGA